MNIWIIIYIVFGILWTFVFYYGLVIHYHKLDEKEQDESPFYEMLAIPISILLGALWIVTAPCCILNGIASERAKKTQ